MSGCVRFRGCARQVQRMCPWLQRGESAWGRPVTACLESLLSFYPKSLFQEFQPYALKSLPISKSECRWNFSGDWIRFLWTDSNSNPTCPLNPKLWRARRIQSPQDHSKVGVSVNRSPKDNCEGQTPPGKVDSDEGWRLRFLVLIHFSPSSSTSYRLWNVFVIFLSTAAG